ncbi:phosphotransferase [Nocardioides ungokensis]|uniref:phosphotransferase n=1 Tax=Nocardioides ungokensis TaxID=1643322 RepID=UPI0015DF5776|nr:phosphotransferase [Nocardioides ungokensis]
MKLIASGRDSDVFEHSDGLVLRRYRDGRSAEQEAATILAVGRLGYPVPIVHGGSGPDIVMERVEGPTLADAMQAGDLTVVEAGGMLARLHDDLHALPWPAAGQGESLLHLDLHPLNVIVAAEGPVVIDWSNARPGPAGLDVALTALIVAQVAVTPGMLPDDPDLEELVRAVVGELLAAFANAVSTPYAEHLAAAEALRRLDPYQSAQELAGLPAAVALAAAPA